MAYDLRLMRTVPSSRLLYVHVTCRRVNQHEVRESTAEA